MINKPTVLILGAGASMDFGYPSGSDLTREVLNITDESNTDAYQCLLSLKYKQRHISDFRNALRKSGRPSVDAFLEHRHKFIDIGKVAMTLALVRFESVDRLFKSTDTWYSYLFNRMGAPFSEFADNKISFITFNYDRSLEVYLVTALRNAYGTSYPGASEVVSKIPIIHVHGKLGNLPWDNPRGRRYSNTLFPERISSAAQGIKIISESSKVDEAFGEARKVLGNCDRIIFLGFGYNRTNLQRLSIDFTRDQSISGSCYGLTRLERSEIASYFKPNRIYLGERGWKVLDFLKENVTL